MRKEHTGALFRVLELVRVSADAPGRAGTRIPGFDQWVGVARDKGFLQIPKMTTLQSQLNWGRGEELPFRRWM
jgi:hypothetical protein